MEFALRPIGLLQDQIGLGKPLGRIAPFVYFDRLDPVSFRVDRRGLRIKRFPLIDDEGENFVVHLDGPYGIPGLIRRFRGYGGDRLALVPALGSKSLTFFSLV